MKILEKDLDFVFGGENNEGEMHDCLKPKKDEKDITLVEEDDTEDAI